MGDAVDMALDRVHVLALVDALARVEGGEGVQRARRVGVGARAHERGHDRGDPARVEAPDSETPTGTSAIMCRRITRSNRSAKLSAYSASLSDEENSGLTSGAQYLVVVVRPSAVTVMKWPGSRRFTPAKKVSSPASCTRWRRNR